MARAGIRASAWSMAAVLLLTPMQARAQAPGAAAPSPTTSATTSDTSTSGASAPGTPASTSAEIPTTPRAQPPVYAPVYAPHEDYTTPRPGPQTSTTPQGPPQPRRWRIRQAPLAGAEASWGAPGNQMPEYAEVNEPPPPEKGPPPRGMGRIITGAILGPAGLGLTIAGIVGATTTMLGENKRLSVPMIGVGLVSSALGWALFADGILRRKAFMRWQSKQGTVALMPTLAPGRFAGLTLVGRF